MGSGRGWRWAAGLALWLVGCGGDGSKDHFTGYVEGEYLYLSSPWGGYLKTLHVHRGGRAAAGEAVFSMENALEGAELAEAQARLESAQARSQNLEQPRKDSEIAVIASQLKGAEAAAELSRLNLERQKRLRVSQTIAAAQWDEARATHRRDEARVEELRRQLTLAREGVGRQEEVRGAAAEERSALARTEQSRWRLAHHETTRAPAAGEVVETYHQPGEWVPAGRPVVGFLPDDRRKMRFHVPQSVLGSIRLGRPVSARCDGCPQPIRGRIDFIGERAEYAPPVIYSRSERARMVFRVEAAPEPGQTPLHPGQPLDIFLEAGDGDGLRH